MGMPQGLSELGLGHDNATLLRGKECGGRMRHGQLQSVGSLRAVA